MEIFGERLRRLRIQRSLSLDELAGQTGLSKAYLWRLETNPDVNPSVEIARRIAVGLGVSIAEVVAASTEQGIDQVQIPPTLRDAQERFKIEDADLTDLARIRFRGAQPVSAEDWGLLYLQLKKTLSEE